MVVIAAEPAATETGFDLGFELHVFAFSNWVLFGRTEAAGESYQGCEPFLRLRQLIKFRHAIFTRSLDSVRGATVGRGFLEDQTVYGMER